MHRRRDGQSMVEMALLLPFLVLVVFGIIDLGYYIYGYASIYQAARNGAEKAAALPPWPSKLSPLDENETCVKSILDETKAVAGQFNDINVSPNSVQISYPVHDANGKPVRALRQPIEISIVYNLRPLTPLWRFVTFGTQGTMTIRTTARRSVEAMGNNPTALNLVACQPSLGES
jgi:Flp pilus assembly protein TadG